MIAPKARCAGERTTWNGPRVLYRNDRLDYTGKSNDDAPRKTGYDITQLRSENQAVEELIPPFAFAIILSNFLVVTISCVMRMQDVSISRVQLPPVHSSPHVTGNLCNVILP